MPFKCNKCGYEVDRLPEITVYDVDGYARTEMNDICACKGDMIKGEHCKICGRFTEVYSFMGGMCEKCYEKYSEE